MFVNGFGDTILATGLYRAVRRAQPRAQLTALAMWPATAALLRSLDVFDEIIRHNFFTAPLLSPLA